MKAFRFGLLFLIGAFILTTAKAQSGKKVSTHMLSQTLNKGKVSNTEADLYFQFPEGIILMYYSYPEEFVFLSNPLGEARLYHPDKNQVVIRANDMLASQNNNLYFFLSNQTYDLGLEGLGFRIIDNEQDDSYFITNWQAPAQLLKQVDKIKLVHKDLLPVHADYLGSKGNSVLKVYYENYKKVSGSQVPSLITEIIFMPNGDSIIKRMQYSDFKYGSAVDISKFNFTIPDDAKVIK